MEVRGSLYFYAEGDGQPEEARQFAEPMLNLIARVHRYYLTTEAHFDPRSGKKTGITEQIYDLIMSANQPIAGMPPRERNRPHNNVELVQTACKYLGRSLDWVMELDRAEQTVRL